MTTPIYELCDVYAERLAVLDPVTATFRGIVGHDTEMTDYSPDGIASRTELDRATLAQLTELSPENDRDRTAADLLSERLSASLALDDTGETLRTLRVIGSPFQAVRQVFDIMPRSTAQDWLTVAARMELVPDGIASVQAALDESAAARHPAGAPSGAGVRRAGDDLGGIATAPAVFRRVGRRVLGRRPGAKGPAQWGRRSGNKGLRGRQRMVAGRPGSPRGGSGRRQAPTGTLWRATSSSGPRSTPKKPTSGAGTSFTGSKPK